ncbi:MAG: AAA family ATPase [Chloroflexota bacterium]|nr:AAA family ATPase [Chloroflexota bacterium]MDE3103337.1 AAA family ATPase [Chloroflexota bacterium]
MRRVSVVGITGAGKTTFARALAQRLGVPFIELDALHWGPGWSAATPEELARRVREATAADAWVVDGGYWGKIGGLVWSRADTVVWLDPPWLLTFVRILQRTIRRSLARTDLWNGNRESLREAFTSRQSLLLYSIRTSRHRRQVWEERISLPEYAHITVHRFRSQRAADEWLAAERPVPADCRECTV